jgi:carboxyl-terminal processing protease
MMVSAVTVARYYTPTEWISIQRNIFQRNESYFKESVSFANGELYEKDSIKVVDILKFRT